MNEIYLLVGGEATRLQPLSSGIPKALLLAIASSLNLPETIGTAGFPIFSTSIMSWHIHDAHVPQSAVAPITTSHSLAAFLSISGGLG